MLTLQINPITGLGGNIAIEDAAELANEIVRLLDETKSYPSDEEIDMAFTRVQCLRKTPATKALRNAAQRQHDDARQSMFAKYVLPLLLKHISRDTLHEASTISTVDATRVKALPVPRRAHFVPFCDEYPEAPLGHVYSAIVTSAAAIGFAGFGYSAWKWRSTEHTHASMLIMLFRAVQRGKFPALSPTRLTQVSRESSLSISSSASVYTTVTVVSTMTMWILEKHRRGNRQAPFGGILRL